MSRKGWPCRFDNREASPRLYISISGIYKGRGQHNGRTTVVEPSRYPAGETHAEIGLLVVKVDLVLRAGDIKRLQRESRPDFRVECGAQLRERPAAGGEVANLDGSVLVLKGDDGGVGAERALVVHGR